MGVMDKFLQYMKINDEDEEYLDDDYLDDEDVVEKPVQKRIAPVKETVETEITERPVNIRKLPQSNRSMQPRQSAAKRVSNGMEVCVIKPNSIEDAREITETLLQNRTVVLNLEGLDVDIAQRIIDFTSGSCFAIDGNLQKISHYIFIITPASVDVSGDFQDLFGGAFNAPLGNDM